jgi:CDP-diacylglycerol--serine O-phosphatidyltransferase
MLMVSNIRYSSFKELGTKSKIRFLHVVISVMVFVAIASNPAITLLIISFAYACSGPLQTLLSLHRVRKQRRQGVRQRINRVKLD